MNKEIIKIIMAYLSDYPRREALAAAHLEKNKGSRSENLRAFMGWNKCIDKAFTVIDEPFRNTMFHDIVNKRGFDKSALREYLTKQRYYKYKNKLLENLEKVLFHHIGTLK